MRVKSLSVAAALAVAFASAAQAQPSTVIVVRHAEKSTAPPANDPVLSAEGMQRSQDLATALEGARVSSVITTQYQRTQLTAKVISDALGKPPIVVPAANPMSAHIAAVVAAVRARPQSDVVLVVGHSNTVPAIIAALGGPKLPDLCDEQYSTIFVLHLSSRGAPSLVKANYGAPDPKDAGSCGAMK